MQHQIFKLMHTAKLHRPHDLYKRSTKTQTTPITTIPEQALFNTCLDMTETLVKTYK